MTIINNYINCNYKSVLIYISLIFNYFLQYLIIILRFSTYIKPGKLRDYKLLLPPRRSFVIVIFGVVVKTYYNCFPRC